VAVARAVPPHQSRRKLKERLPVAPRRLRYSVGDLSILNITFRVTLYFEIFADIPLNL
jgi:hypothetical protein